MRMATRVAVAFAAVLAMASVAAGAATAPADPPRIVTLLRSAGASVTPLGAAGGLAGWYVDRGGGDVYTLYVTPAGHAVTGLLYGPDGAALTPRQVAAAFPAPAATPSGDSAPAAPPDASRAAVEATPVARPDVAPPAAVPPASSPVEPDREVAAALMAAAAVPPAAPPVELAQLSPRAEPARLLALAMTPFVARKALASVRIWDAAGAVFGFAVGPPPGGGRRYGSAQLPLEVRVLADPTCPWSRLAVARLAQRATAGDLRLRIVPVGVLGEAAAWRAVSIAAASDPLAVWFGGDVETAAPREGAVRIRAANALFASAGAPYVPAVYARFGDLAPVRLADGEPELLRFLRALADPAFAR